MRPYIIAELSSNFMSAFAANSVLRSEPHPRFCPSKCASILLQSKSSAYKLIYEAALAGANAIKLQTFTPNSMVADMEYEIQDGPWKGRKLIDLYREAHTPLDWHASLFSYAKIVGIEAFSTVYDCDAVDFLESIGCPMYKISSFEVPDIELIRYVASKGKPMIISTGMASFGEIQSIMRAVGHQAKVTLLKCTSAYPAKPSDANLATIRDMARYFHCDIGLSDHTLGSAVACAAVGMGAVVFEKHLTLSRSRPTLDREFSSEPKEFKQYVQDIHDAWLAVGGICYGPMPAEASSRKLRRSLYFAHDLEEGTMLMRHHFRTARPAEGLAPDTLPLLIGQHLSIFVKAGQPVSWGQVRE